MYINYLFFFRVSYLFWQNVFQVVSSAAMFLTNRFEVSSPYHLQFDVWLGLTRSKTCQQCNQSSELLTWRWRKGQSLQWANWYNEGTSRSPGTKNCVSVSSEKGWQWIPTKCFKWLHFMCEKGLFQPSQSSSKS